MSKFALNDFRNLALLLPPNLKVAAGEAADVTSAVAAFLEHGDGIMAAAGEGAQAVADFLHDDITEQAKAAGVPAAELPQKGNAVETVQHKPGTAPATGGVTHTDLANFKQALMGDIKQLLGDVLGGAAAEPPAADPPEAGGEAAGAGAEGDSGTGA